MNKSLANTPVMEMIDPVKADETLIDHGTYHYYTSTHGVEEKMAVIEPWSRHQSGNKMITRSERDARALGSQILVQSESVDGVIEQFDVVMRTFTEDQVYQVSANYLCAADRITVTRTDAKGETTEHSQHLGDYIVSPLMRIYTGDVIQRLLGRGEQQVLVPWIRDPNDLEQLLTPLTSQRQAHLEQSETISIADRAVETQRYQYFGGEYQPGTLFWMDQGGVLQRYLWQQNDVTCWDTRLETYSRA